MQVASGLAAMSAVTDRAVALSCSALLSGAARDALKSFFRSTQQGAAALPHDALRGRLLRAGTTAPRAAQRSAAECVAALSEGSPDRVAETMRLCIQSLEQASSVCPPPHHHHTPAAASQHALVHQRAVALRRRHPPHLHAAHRCAAWHR